MRKLITISKDYPILRRKVEETLLLGQRKIEEAKVQTYWRTGRLISDHLLRHDSRADHYGQQVIEKLSKDLEISTTVLWRCVQFARSFKILAGWRESFPASLSWSHYRELIGVPDEETRVSFMHRAEKSGWTAQELAQRISQEIPRGSAPHGPGGTIVSYAKLIPKKGQVYTYRLIAPDSVYKQEEERLWIDLGFQVHRQIPEAAFEKARGRGAENRLHGFKESDIIESRKKDGDYGIIASSRKEADLFTYKAFVERVVDGDTLIVKIDLGFETRVRQYLRLRGIDAPELDTPEGKKARDFVVRELSRVPHIILTSSRSDKYDRYLADVFYGEGEKEKYLNQILLDEGLAERME